MRVWIGVLVCLASGSMNTREVRAQDSPQVAAVVISGTVVDAETLAPIAGAAVALIPGTEAVFPAGGDHLGVFATANKVSETGPAGAYRFDGLAPGEYTLRVQYLGYRPATVRVELRGPGAARVSFGLTVDPVRLEPVAVTEESRDLMHARLDERAAVALDRRPAIRLRQQRHLATDVRALTHDELVEAVTLGEDDIFRALRRLPGVTTWDEVSTELWTRGAGRAETVVLFDGLPLYEPLHGAGDLTAVSPEGIGMAFFHPGVRPASLAGASAAVLDLPTRPGAGDAEGHIRGAADVSLSSLRGSVDGRSSGGDVSWLLAGRRSYIDLLRDNSFQAVQANQFWDLTGRVDLHMGNGRRVAVSGLWQSNGYNEIGRNPETDFPAFARWSGGDRGTTVARATLHALLPGGLTSAHTAGFSRFAVEAGQFTPRVTGSPTNAANPIAVLVPASSVALTHWVVRGEVEPRDGGRTWGAGYEVVRESAEYDGAKPEPRSPFYVDEPDRLVSSDARTRVGLWSQRRWHPTARLELEAGTRLEIASVGNDPVRIAPDLMARFALTDHASLFAGLGRSYQYAQTLAPTGVSNIRHPHSMWLIASDSVPAIRSDVAAAGAEAWVGGSSLASLNGWVRRSAGLVLPDPTPGLSHASPSFEVGKRRAHGVEGSVRRVSGRATLSLAYSYSARQRRWTVWNSPPPRIDPTRWMPQHCSGWDADSAWAQPSPARRGSRIRGQH